MQYFDLMFFIMSWQKFINFFYTIILTQTVIISIIAAISLIFGVYFERKEKNKTIWGFPFSISILSGVLLIWSAINAQLDTVNNENIKNKILAKADTTIAKTEITISKNDSIIHSYFILNKESQRIIDSLKVINKSGITLLKASQNITKQNEIILPLVVFPLYQI